MLIYNIFELKICRCAGIGRRGRLKICCQQWRVGSSPTTGTKIKKCNESCIFFVRNKKVGLEKEHAKFRLVQGQTKRR